VTALTGAESGFVAFPDGESSFLLNRDSPQSGPSTISDRQPEDPGLPAQRCSNGDSRAVELGERKALERLVIYVALIPQNTDGDGLTQQKRLLGV
jgi:hypothetical protein